MSTTIDTGTRTEAAEPTLFEGYEVAGHSFTVSGEVDSAGPPMEYQETRWLLVKVKCQKVVHEPAAKGSPEPERIHKLVVDHARPLEDAEVIALATQAGLAMRAADAEGEFRPGLDPHP